VNHDLSLDTDTTMRAHVLTTFGQPLSLSTLPRPVAGEGEVLVRIVAAGLNPLDVKIAAGAAGHARVTPPAILGLDAAGVVAAVGPGVTDLAVGDEVFGMVGGVGTVPGSLAEYAAVDASLLARKPRAWTFAEAAAVPLGFITAWEGLVDRARVSSGGTVLVHGGAGGVGHLAVQIAAARGAEVFATGSARQHDLIAALGAKPIDYATTPVGQYVDQHTGGAGFDVVLDTVGGENLDRSFAAARTYVGHVVSSLGWGTHSLAPLSFKGATYSGVFTLLPLLTGEGRAHHGEILRAAADLADRGLLRPIVHGVPVAFDRAEDALAAVAAGVPAGKVVVEVAPGMA
jgi:NADPH:quinone reductase-like Zn-dependent oxidoreductase